MGILDKFKERTDGPRIANLPANEPVPPQVRAQAQPIAVNPRAHSINLRQASRLLRLYSAKNLSAEIQEAIEVCTAHLRVNGLTNPPRNGAEAQRLVTKLNKGA